VANSLLPRVFRAPGRVNLIGEHTDYNEGFVMPVALDFATCVSVSPRSDEKLTIFSRNFDEQVECDLRSLPLRRGHWSDYPVGVAYILQQDGHHLRGASLLLEGDVPLGAGLSSSASVEVATALALVASSNLNIDRAQIAQLCRRAENEYVGARVGIMDQFVSLFGAEGRALMLDCRSLEYELLPVPDTVSLVICNTMVKHELASSGYNERRAQCEEGVRILSEFLPQVRALRDVGVDDLGQFGSELPEVVFRRCRHIVTENARVIAAAEALRRHDLNAFGKLMIESHKSLRDDFEVSCRELDLMVELNCAAPGVYGSRMTGGGFGGCTVSVVAADRVDEFKDTVTEGYARATTITPDIYICHAAAGASEI
jgi:galactokinase